MTSSTSICSSQNTTHMRKRFWTASQANFYSSLLFDKDKVYDHAHILHVDMELLSCFTLVLGVLHEAGLLNFCTNIVDWNEELILQFYAMLHITGNAEDVNSWVLDWMTNNTHFKAPTSEFFMPCLSVLPLKVHVVSIMNLSYLTITCKF